MSKTGLFNRTARATASILLSLTLSINAETLCNNAALRTFGECTPITECPQFYSILLNRNRTLDQAAVLRNSTCGHIGKIPKLCCPYERFSDPSSACGLRSFTSDRIIPRGDYAAIDEYPWTAIIESTERKWNRTVPTCGGTLISSRYVLTAAHCLALDRALFSAPMRVRLGDYILSKDPDCVTEYADYIDCNDPSITISIEYFVAHERFDTSDKSRRDDIGLVRMSASVAYSDFVRPICIVPFDIFSTKLTNAIHYPLRSTGWGIGHTSSSTSDTKVQTPFRLASTSDCQEGLEISMTDGDVCVKSARKYIFAVDSGASLMASVVNIAGSSRYEIWFAVGVAKGLAALSPDDNSEAIVAQAFTRVDHHYHWIINKMKP